jgi:predicted Rossmann-fold nucleotide-binding protein
MEAVSRGAAEAGGHVIGITCEEIERWRGAGANHWVTEEWKKETLIQRLQALIESCDVALALPGGPGTLTEISLMWNLMIIGSLHRRPLILIGESWQTVFNQVFLTLGDYSPSSQRELLQFSPDIKSALEIIDIKG